MCFANDAPHAHKLYMTRSRTHLSQSADGAAAAAAEAAAIERNDNGSRDADDADIAGD
jgi:hypothetical protein